ncbi:MAG: hypothetical protein Q7V57_18600 [Actinomycetota bacterium]|nr:hypothetical protein [Actinomycetota bacterium]
MTHDGMYQVERVAVPRLEGVDDAVARDVFGEQAEWGFAIPWMYQALAAPRARRPVLRAPEPGDHFWPGALGYWSALLHLLVYGFGWSRPDSGLRWWHVAERPVDDPKLALLSEIWDADGQLDWFAAWLWTSGGRDYLPRSSAGSEGQGVEVDDRWLADVEQRITNSGTPAPFGGGSDPFHLSAHIDGPLQQTRAGAQLAIAPSGERRASLTLDSMTGWYAALTDEAGSLPGHEASPSWNVDVVVRGVGWLGTYRRSRTTGLWFSGRHLHHQVGN